MPPPIKYIDFESRPLWDKRCNNIIPVNSCLLSRGRDALTLIANEIKEQGYNDSILLPAFICEIVPRTFISYKLKPVFYDLHSNLVPNISDIERKRKGADFILVINYFGFKQPKSILSQIKQLGLKIIEDDIPSLPDFEDSNDSKVYWSIKGFRKQLPVPDGAVLLGPISAKVILKPMGWPQRKNIFWRVLGLIMRQMEDKWPNRYFEEMEKDCFRFELRSRGYPSIAPMHPLSQSWYRRMDLKAIYQKRRENYQVLKYGLKNIPGLRLVDLEMDIKSCPLGFPLLAEKRDLLFNKLRKNGIAAAILWEFPGFISEKRHYEIKEVCEKIIVLPVGHSYGPEEMRYIIEKIKQ